MRTRAPLYVVLALLLPLAGCGGGSKSNTTPQVSISVFPTSPSVNVGATQQFTATVSGTTNTAVSWTTGGPGTISATGLYSAPANMTTPGSVTVTATAQADASKSASAAISIPAVSAAISPNGANTILGATQQFTATVTNATNTAVDWTVTGPGTVSAAGLYSAPASFTTPATVTLKATTKADPSKSATVTVNIPSVLATISPGTVDTILGATQQFTADVSNATDKSVIWSVTSSGTISGSGLYQAPGTLVTPSSATITATPNADPTKSFTATVTIPAVSVTLTPGTVTLGNGYVQAFAATVSHATECGVTWTMTGKGSVDPLGKYTAPMSFTDGETATVKATSKADITKSITASVTLQSIPRTVTGYVIMPDTDFKSLTVDWIDKGTGKLRPAGVTFVSTEMYTNPNMVATHPTKPFVYTVAGFIGVLGYTLSPNGALAPIAGSPFSAPNFRPEGMKITPDGKFLYVSNTYGPMWGWSIDQNTGALTSLIGSPWNLGTNSSVMAVDASSKHLYAMTAGDYQDATVLVFEIDPAAGTLTGVQSITAPGSGGASGMGFDPSGKFLYTIGFYNGVVDGFKIDASTGQLTFIPGAPFAGGYVGEALAVDPLGKYVFAGNQGGVGMYAIDGSSGALTQVAGSPFFTGFGESSDFHLDPTGSVLYTNEGYTTTALKVDRINNKLTYLNSVHTRDTGGGTGRWVRFNLAQAQENLSLKSKFAYVLNNQDKAISIYTIDDTTGELSPAGSPVATGNNPQAMAMDWYGNFLYVVNKDSNTVSAFTINHATGALTAVAGSPFATGPAPTGVVVETTGRALFVGTSGDDSLLQYTINPTSGALTLAGSSPTGQCSGARSLVADWRGDYFYQLCPESNKTAVYALDIPTGRMSSTSPIQVIPLAGPSLALSPYGAAPPHSPNWHSFGFMVSQQDQQIKHFIVGNVGSMDLASSGPVGVNQGLALDPLGRFAYATNATGNKVQAVAIDPSEGSLSEIQGSPWDTGVYPIAAAVDATGRFVYVVNRDSNTVSGYMLNQTTGALMPMTPQTFSTGAKPVAILIAAAAE